MGRNLGLPRQTDQIVEGAVTNAQCQGNVCADNQQRRRQASAVAPRLGAGLKA